MFLPAEEYFKAFCTFSSLFGCADNVTPKQMAESNAFKFESPIIANNFLVYIRNNSFSVAFPAYFHELGHIATSSFTKRKDVEKHSRLILAEMLADSFESWAYEEFNNISKNFKFENQLYLLCYRVESQKDAETADYRSNAAMESDRRLLKFYEKKKPKTFGNLYKILSSEVRAQQNITSLDFLIA